MKRPCDNCSGMGTVTDIDVSATVCPFTEAVCPECDGDGETDALCETCEAVLRDDGWCASCEGWQIEVVADPLRNAA